VTVATAVLPPAGSAWPRGASPPPACFPSPLSNLAAPIGALPAAKGCSHLGHLRLIPSLELAGVESSLQLRAHK